MPNIKDCERGPTSGLSASKGPLLGGSPSHIFIYFNSSEDSGSSKKVHFLCSCLITNEKSASPNINAKEESNGLS
jgi:hypothetical protein